MCWRIKVLVIISVCFFSCKKRGHETNHGEILGYYSTKHLIECNELKELNDSNLKIIDFRKPKAFIKGHIANAINIWRTDIEDASFPYKGIMASKSQIESLFSKLGIENNNELIIYDNSGACDASRLWWVLKNYGFHKVKILNGGLAQWKHCNGKLSSQIIEYPPSKFKLPEAEMPLYIGLEGMKQIVVDSNTVILDTRNKDEFSGKRQKKGASRGGHIPKSILLDWAEAIDYGHSKKFKSYEDLLKVYKNKGITKDKSVFVYCHSGVRSAHTTFVLTELLGFKKVKNYDGSWVEWSYYKDLGIEKDTLTTIFK